MSMRPSTAQKSWCAAEATGGWGCSRYSSATGHTTSRTLHCSTQLQVSAMQPRRISHYLFEDKETCRNERATEKARAWVSWGMHGPSMLMRNCMREASTKSASHSGRPLALGRTSSA